MISWYQAINSFRVSVTEVRNFATGPLLAYLEPRYDEFRELQETLLENPARGDLISGGAGLRKLRWAWQGIGKSGGLRAIYYWAVTQDQILLVFVYPKSKMEGISQGGK